MPGGSQAVRVTRGEPHLLDTLWYGRCPRTSGETTPGSIAPNAGTGTVNSDVAATVRRPILKRAIAAVDTQR
jgi:hypothetical protein